MKNQLNINSATNQVRPGSISHTPMVLKGLTREKILEYFQNSWSLTELLFSGLKNKRAFYQLPYHNLRHPLIFYYAHPAVCYMYKLKTAKIILDTIQPALEQIFETGVDEMTRDDMFKNTRRWPEIEEVKEYRSIVKEQVENLIKFHPAFATSQLRWKDPGWALMLAMEHERIHLETSSVLIRELPLDLLEKPNSWPSIIREDRNPSSVFGSEPDAFGSEPECRFVPAQTVYLGKSLDAPYYGWDNEYGNKTMHVKEFYAGKYLITNREFLAFVKDQGYSKQIYWTKKGWQWLAFRKIKHPTFWVPIGTENATENRAENRTENRTQKWTENGAIAQAGELHDYELRTCFEIIPMQWSWPAIVNYHEAKAYCAWLSEQHKKPYRLLAEGEHHALRGSNSNENIPAFEKIFMKSNINLRYGSESPVKAFPENSKGFFDVVGNVWQWCEDHFCPLSSFEPHPYYSDFSTPCFDGEHQIIMGGSFISTGNEATPWARFHFRPHFFQHAGFRVVQAAHLETSCMEDMERMEGMEGMESPRHPMNGKVCCQKHHPNDKKIQSHDENNYYTEKNVLDEYLLLHYGDYKSVVHRSPIKSKENFLACPKYSTKISNRYVQFPKKCADLIKQLLLGQNGSPKCFSNGRFLDVGCAVGRVCFDLAASFQEIIGVDNSEIFIESANKLKSGEIIKYFRKEEGNIVTPCTIKLKNADKKYSNIKFKVEDACQLSKNLGSFNVILLANVLCRIDTPEKCLIDLSSSTFLRENGILILISPYSWLESFTKRDAWLSARNSENKNKKSRETIIEILQPRLKLIDEFEMPCLIREHARKFQLIMPHGMIWKKI